MHSHTSAFLFDHTREIYYFAYGLTYTPGMTKPMRKNHRAYLIASIYIIL